MNMLRQNMKEFAIRIVGQILYVTFDSQGYISEI